jgi:CheY-like chemotaxis protein
MKKILIVEDDRGIVMSLEIRLGAAGYQVHKAYDGVTAVKTALEVEPDFLLLDIAVPEGGGFHVVETLKSHAATRNTPFIFFTANQKPGLREKAESLGAVDFFQKPYDTPALLAAIENALAGPVRSYK